MTDKQKDLIENTQETRIAAYLDGALEDEEAKAVAGLLAISPEARQTARLLQAAQRVCRPPRERLEIITENVMARLQEGALETKAAQTAAAIHAAEAEDKIVLAETAATIAAHEKAMNDMPDPNVVSQIGDKASSNASAPMQTASWFSQIRRWIMKTDDNNKEAKRIPFWLQRRQRYGLIAILAACGFVAAMYGPAGITSFWDRAERMSAMPKELAELSAPADPVGATSAKTGLSPIALGTEGELRSISTVVNPVRFDQAARAFGGAKSDQPKRNAFSIPKFDYISDSILGDDVTWDKGGESAEHNTETYDRVAENPFHKTTNEPLSTFSIDVDTASYSIVRRYLNQNQLPPPDAVRIEEMLNYFPYEYAPPASNDPDPFAVNIETANCPWALERRLVRIGIKGREMPNEERPQCNLVFLLDVSGSMQEAKKLPLVKQAMTMLTGNLNVGDRVAIITYADGTKVALPSTPCSDKPAITRAIESLQAGGSTNGEGGIQLAYQSAQENFIKSGVNRVVLCTDGDFNVGVTDQGQLTRMIEEKAKSGIFLSIFGFGTGNLKDSTLVKLADKGNGNYGYIDTINEARKALVEQINGTLVTIAKDVKIQVEFNPAQVAAYRLVGYEKRMLKAQDFNDDKKDAGEIGAGHTVTAMYEIVLANSSAQGAGLGTRNAEPGTPKAELGTRNSELGTAKAEPGTRPSVDPLRYQTAPQLTPTAGSGEMLTVKLRYTEPDVQASKLIDVPVIDSGLGLDTASGEFIFAPA
ncbi:MAG: VWA domain-containing protein, partial [Candidatus Sumerlaeota bacterium]|nr:VWA domain-containing protein [Candidatus Sumerlaeota bacterium]